MDTMQYGPILQEYGLLMNEFLKTTERGRKAMKSESNVLFEIIGEYSDKPDLVDFVIEKVLDGSFEYGALAKDFFKDCATEFYKE